MELGIGVKKKSLYLGIDPGFSGSLCLIDADGRFFAAIKLRETYKSVWEWLDARRDLVDFAMLEKVHAFPQDGKVAAFRFGESFGYLQGLLVAAGIRHDLVTPMRWQKELGCLTQGKKNVTYVRAQQLWPDVKITHAVADALLIAEYARRTRHSFMATK